jgi:hypothetical protein
VLWDRGRDGGYLPLFMTGSDTERVNFTNHARLRRVKKNIYIPFVHDQFVTTFSNN